MIQTSSSLYVIFIISQHVDNAVKSKNLNEVMIYIPSLKQVPLLFNLF